jgi:hypothetical protein
VPPVVPPVPPVVPPVPPVPPEQTPAEQLCPVAHAWPHAPQFAVSLLVFTQAAPQNVCPLGHWQLPATHERPPSQALLHAPQ